MATVKAAWSRIVEKLRRGWKSVKCPCSHCGNLIDPVAIGDDERIGWCPRCEQVFRLPLLKVQGWVLGAVLLLAVKLQMGI